MATPSSVLGRSGARVDVHEDYVVKVMPDAAEQAALLERLGADVGPVVFAKGEGLYVMERLDPLPADVSTAALLREARAVLERVWAQGAPERPFVFTTWSQRFKTWAEDAGEPRLWTWAKRLYAPYGAVAALTHGDPTLANAMHREGEMVFIDPLPARGKIPPLREVDVGKLLQSALGWEHILDPEGWSRGTVDDVNAVLEPEAPEMHERIWFWCAVHLTRIYLRERAREPRLAEFVRAAYGSILAQWGMAPCTC